jgi:hypothetical protein
MTGYSASTVNQHRTGHDENRRRTQRPAQSLTTKENTVLCPAGHRPAYMTERSIVRVMDDGGRQPARCRSRCEARAPSIMSSRPLRTEGLYDKRVRECATVKWRPPDGERWSSSAGDKPRDLHACVAPKSRLSFFASRLAFLLSLSLSQCPYLPHADLTTCISARFIVHRASISLRSLLVVWSRYVRASASPFCACKIDTSHRRSWYSYQCMC